MNTRTPIQTLAGAAIAFLACASVALAQTPRIQRQSDPLELAGVSFDTDSLDQIYDGTPRAVLVTTQPAGLAVEIHYEGLPDAPVDSGYYEVIATVVEPGWIGGATNFLAIDRAPQTVLFGLPETALASQTILLNAASSSGQIPAIGVVSGPGIIQGNTLVFTNQGVCVVAACVNGNENWRNACEIATVQVSRATAQITLYNLTQVYDGSSCIPYVETEPEFLPFEILYDGSPLPPVNAGSYAIDVRITDPRWDGEISEQFTIARGEQIMYFDNPGVCAQTSTPDLVAATSAWLPADFTLVEGPASILATNGRFFATFTDTGRVSIAASHPGTANWLPSATVTQTFLVFENPLHIQIQTDVAIYDGTPQAVRLIFPAGSELTSNDIAVTYSGSFDPPINAGSYDLFALITNPPSLQGGYIGTFLILKADDEIEFDAPDEITANQTLALAATSLSGRTCIFYALPTQTARIENQSNLVFIAAGDALVCAYVNEDANWNAAEEWVWVTAMKADIAVNLRDLFQPFDGTVRIVNGHADVDAFVEIRYDGSLEPPVAVGRYAISGTLAHPIYQGSAQGTLIVLDHPEVSLTSSNDVFRITWPAEPGIRYAVQQATSPLGPWPVLPPFVNLVGNGLLSVDVSATNATHYRIVAYP